MVASIIDVNVITVYFHNHLIKKIVWCINFLDTIYLRFIVFIVVDSIGKKSIVSIVITVIRTNYSSFRIYH